MDGLRYRVKGAVTEPVSTRPKSGANVEKQHFRFCLVAAAPSDAGLLGHGMENTEQCYRRRAGSNDSSVEAVAS